MKKLHYLICSCVLLAAMPVAAATVDFGSSPSGPIADALGGGDFTGTEYAALGIFFAPQSGQSLNIACGSGAPGDQANCLTSDASGPDSYDGTVFISFALGGVDHAADAIEIQYLYGDTRTIVRDRLGNVILDQASGNVSFSNPDIFSVQYTTDVDAADSINFGNLSPVGSAVPEPTTVALMFSGLAALVVARRK